MIPRLGDGNHFQALMITMYKQGLENDSPSRGRKLEAVELYLQIL